MFLIYDSQLVSLYQLFLLNNLVLTTFLHKKSFFGLNNVI